MKTLNVFIVGLFAIGLAGASQLALAGPVGTEVVTNDQARTAILSDIEVMLAKASIAEELESQGVTADMLEERLNALSTAELLELESSLNQAVAGADAIGIIGAVFLVLLILELVGVTDVFKAI
jgi:hypothetical protein